MQHNRSIVVFGIATILSALTAQANLVLVDEGVSRTSIHEVEQAAVGQRGGLGTRLF